VTFTLRSEVKFHDGTPLTAGDVKATLERDLDPKTSSVVPVLPQGHQDRRPPDPNTVVLTLLHPDTSLADRADVTSARRYWRQRHQGGHGRQEAQRHRAVRMEAVATEPAAGPDRQRRLLGREAERTAAWSSG